jgi:hypothetical protein
MARSRIEPETSRINILASVICSFVVVGIIIIIIIIISERKLQNLILLNCEYI